MTLSLVIISAVFTIDLHLLRMNFIMHGPQAEEAVRALDASLAQSRARCQQLEGAVRSRDKEVAQLEKQYDRAVSGELAGVVGKQLLAEETVKKLDTDVVSLRHRVLQLEGMLKARDNQVWHCK